MEGDSSSEIEITDEDVLEKHGTKDDNPQLADAMAKVLRMSGKKVLSKAKLCTDKKVTPVIPVKKEYDFEIDGQAENLKQDVTIDDAKPEIDKKEGIKFGKITRDEKLNRGRLKPTVLDKEREKPLIKIATKGVVQLFNAVKQQQTKISKQVEDGKLTEVKKEKILKSIDKNEFLDLLMGRKTSKQQESNGDTTTPGQEEVNEEDEDDVSEAEDTEPDNSTWQVLKDDFMMGAKLKDWDKSVEPEPAVKRKKIKM